MKVDAEDFRQFYGLLSDESLLSINREELVEIAKKCFDEEVTRRGLQYKPHLSRPEGSSDEFVSAAVFRFPDEAKVARALLQSTGVISYLENEHTLSALWTLSNALGDLRLMVPASQYEAAKAILEETLTNEELTALFPSETLSPELIMDVETRLTTRIGRNGSRAKWALALAMLMHPALDQLRLFYIWK